MTPKLSAEQRQALDDQEGRPIVVVDADRQQRFLLVPDTDNRLCAFSEDDGSAQPWTDQLELRRRELIDKDIAGSLTPDERIELAVLDQQGNAYYDTIAPRPMDGLRELHQQLLNQRDHK